MIKHKMKERIIYTLNIESIFILILFTVINYFFFDNKPLLGTRILPFISVTSLCLAATYYLKINFYKSNKHKIKTSVFIEAISNYSFLYLTHSLIIYLLFSMFSNSFVPRFVVGILATSLFINIVFFLLIIWAINWKSIYTFKE